MLTVKIPKEMIDVVHVFSKRAVENSKHYRQKFLTGSEDKNQFLGYLLEHVACWHWKRPYPKILPIGEIDEFDLEIGGKEFDVKHSPGCHVNREQFYRKKVDGYIFGNTRLLDFASGMIFADFYGWIEKERLPEISEIIPHPNGSVSFKANKRKLRKMEALA